MAVKIAAASLADVIYDAADLLESCFDDEALAFAGGKVKITLELDVSVLNDTLDGANYIDTLFGTAHVVTADGVEEVFDLLPNKEEGDEEVVAAPTDDTVEGDEASGDGGVDPAPFTGDKLEDHKDD